EGVLDRTPLHWIVRRCAEIQVRLDHQDLRPHALEAHDVRVAEVTTVQPDVVVSDAGRQRRVVEDVLVEAADLEVYPPGLLIPVERQEAVQLLHAGRLRGDRGDGAAVLLLRDEGHGEQRDRQRGARDAMQQHRASCVESERAPTGAERKRGPAYEYADPLVVASAPWCMPGVAVSRPAHAREKRRSAAQA